MSRPPSDKFPPVLVSFMEATGESAPYISDKLGFGENWIYNTFSGDLSDLKKYRRISEAAGLDGVHVLIKYIEQGKARAVFDRLAKRHGTSAPFALAKKIGVSRGPLTRLQENEEGLNGLNSYARLAKYIGCEVDQLLEKGSGS